MDRTPVYDQVGYSRLTTASCVKQNSVYDEYIKYHGFKEWTKLNCEYFMMGNRIKECSLLKTSGIEVNTANVSETMRLIDQLGTEIMFYNYNIIYIYINVVYICTGCPITSIRIG
jgi:hypothetical protein